jgi:hypothetical protein
MRRAYSQLFDEMSDALSVERENLIHWFRTVDKTSDLVGKRQALTFRTLAALAGSGDLPARANSTKKPSAASDDTAKKAMPRKATAKKSAAPQAPALSEARGANGPEGVRVGQEVGLTVRVEINLPPGGDAETYDAIFASIKKHLIS